MVNLQHSCGFNLVFWEIVTSHHVWVIGVFLLWDSNNINKKYYMCTSIFKISKLPRYMDLMDIEFLEAVLAGRFIIKPINFCSWKKSQRYKTSHSRMKYKRSLKINISMIFNSFVCTKDRDLTFFYEFLYLYH